MSEGRPHRTTVVSRAEGEQPAADARQALGALEALLTTAKGRLRDRVIESGRASKRGVEAAIVGVTPVAPPRISSMLFEQRQVAAHALAHLAVRVESAREVLAWAERRADRLARRTADALVAEAILGARHGVAVGPGEIVSLLELDLGDEEIERTIGRAALVAWAHGAGGSDAMQNLAESSLEGDAPTAGRDDDAAQVARRAKLREAGTASATAGESIRAALAAWGAAGAFDAADPTTTGVDAEARFAARIGAANALEELGRLAPALGPPAVDVWTAAASISAFGTDAQKSERLPALASGSTIAVLALGEPNVPGVGAPRTCAESTDDGRLALFGDKAARLHVPEPDLLFVLARTDTTRAGTAGSSLLLAEMSAGASGVAIEPGGLAFDGLDVAPGGVVGGTPGHASEQLDIVLAAGWFASAAVAVGVAQAALELAAGTARERLSGAAPLLRRPRVAARLGRLIVLTTAARRTVAAAARGLGGGGAGGDDGNAFATAAIARIASTHAATAAIAIARDFAALVGRRSPVELATMEDTLRAGSSFGSEDDTAEALARRLLA